MALFSLLLAVIALSPAFKSQDLTNRGLQLAEWTALKDFVEECRQEIAAGLESQACLKAVNAKIPPPPYMDSSVLGNTRRGIVLEQPSLNDTQEASTGVLAPPSLGRGVVSFLFLLTICGLLLFSIERDHSGLRQLSTRDKFETGLNDEDWEHPSEIMTDHTMIEPVVRHPPGGFEGHLRERVVRIHPIYRHSSLDEAIHAADLDEIRLRLRNGEDVNRHWPYLIFSLAISPDTADLAQRIEVARLCLDFGADVNASKGWNGQTALLIAIRFGNVAVARLLIANGATVNFAPTDTLLTALHGCVRLAASGSSSSALEIMEILCRHGADVNRVDRFNETPLQKLLIEASNARYDGGIVERLVPIAQCLIDYDANMPVTLRDRFVVGNPLYGPVQAAFQKGPPFRIE